MKKKTKLALQVVSHCDTTSQREHYVQKLKKYIKISEYGKCSGNVCNKDECMDAQIDKHLFYLAFENSVCQHYVTEKFWHVKRLIVPIVLSREHVQGLGIPNNAFIAASDFTSPQKLAEHLLYLQQNPKEYLKYFYWTRYYTKSGVENPLCQLCQMAVEKHRKEIKDIVQWWESSANCEPNFVDKFLLH